MKVLNLDIRTNNDIDTIQKMLNVYLSLHNIKLCASEITVLAALILYRPTVQTRRYIMNEMKVYQRKTSFHNAIYKFKKLGLVIAGDYGEMKINPKIDVHDGKVGMIVKLEPKS